ncbi:MAG: tetratricopeptide repeat protein [Thiotrichaceae bacterium]
MYKKTSSQLFIPIKGYGFTTLIVSGFGLMFVGLFPIITSADEALMQPVQDIHFQELPPPWESQPVPKIAVPVVAVAKSKSPQKPIKPIMKQAVRVAPKVAIQAPKVSAPKQTTIQSLMAAAKKNDSQAQYDLGMRYQYGNGVKKSRSTAHRWLSKSAESGNARAQYALSLFYQQYARNQQGVKKALLWLKRAADQGLVDAQYSLGMMFKNGSLVHNNPAESKKWLQMAASQGHVSAQLALK